MVGTCFDHFLDPYYLEHAWLIEAPEKYLLNERKIECEVIGE